MVSSWSLVASKPALYAGFGSLIDNPIERKVYYAKIIIKMYRTKGTLPANIPQFRQACPRMVTRQPTLLLTMLMITPSAPSETGFWNTFTTAYRNIGQSSAPSLNPLSPLALQVRACEAFFISEY